MSVHIPRPFLLMIDSGSREEPSDRRFASFDAALAAFEEYDEKFQRFAWIYDLRSTTVLMSDGKIAVSASGLSR